MKLDQTKTLPTTRSVLRFDDDEVIRALKMLAKEKGYKISQSGKCSIWYPRDGNSVKTSLVIDNNGNDFSIENFDEGDNS